MLALQLHVYSHSTRPVFTQQARRCCRIPWRRAFFLASLRVHLLQSVLFQHTYFSQGIPGVGYEGLQGTYT